MEPLQYVNSILGLSHWDFIFILPYELLPYLPPATFHENIIGNPLSIPMIFFAPT